MGTIRKPASDAALQRLCELHAELEGKVASIERQRDAAIAGINAAADRQLAPRVAELDKVKVKIEPYFMAHRERLLPKNRKSMELGGCELGSRAGTDTVVVDGDELAVVAALRKLRWALPLLNVRVSLKRPAVKTALEGKRKDELTALGVRVKPGEDAFFIKRTEQGGTPGKS